MAALIAFNEVRFPTDISFGSTFGREFATEVIQLASGFEGSTQVWTAARGTGDVRYGVKTTSQLYTLYTFFLAHRGQAIGFRYKDKLDYTATLEGFGIGNGVTTVFQLYKQYGVDPDLYAQPITKPVGIGFPIGNTYASVTLYANGIPTAGSVDHTTGKVTFGSPPGVGVVLRWSGEYDIAMRFASDKLLTSLALIGVGQTEPIPILEVLPVPLEFTLS